MESSEMEHNPTHTASEEFDYDYFSDFEFEG